MAENTFTPDISKYGKICWMLRHVSPDCDSRAFGDLPAFSNIAAWAAQPRRQVAVRIADRPKVVIWAGVWNGVVTSLDLSYGGLRRIEPFLGHDSEFDASAGRLINLPKTQLTHFDTITIDFAESVRHFAQSSGVER